MTMRNLLWLACVTASGLTVPTAKRDAVGEKCEKATIANVDADGDGDCYCQYGPRSKIHNKPDNDGWMSCHLSDSTI